MNPIKKYILDNKRWIVKLLLFLVAMTFVCIMFYRPFMDVVENKEAFKDWLEQFGVWAYVIYIIVNIAQIFLAFLPGEPIEVLAGFCFGPWVGMLLCLIAAFIGSSIVFLGIRRFGNTFINKFFNQEEIDKVSFLKQDRKVVWVAFILFMIPGTPKDAMTYVLPLTSIKYNQFIWIATIARLPSIISSTFAGDALLQQDYLSLVMIYLVTGIIGAIGLYGYNLYKKKHQGI